MQNQDLENLKKRMGEDALSHRLERQTERAAQAYTRNGLTRFHPENSVLVPALLRILCKSIGIYQRGRRNTLEYQAEYVKCAIPGLPSPFHGFRILQISDLHADGILDNGKRLQNIVEGTSCDLLVFTGDCRFQTTGPYKPAIEVISNMIEHLYPAHGKFGILGNHDAVECVSFLEKAGLQMLLNEAVEIRKQEEVIRLSGVDDPHMYVNHDLNKVCKPEKTVPVHIMLSHTPEIYKQAEDKGVNSLICGHTHGGQICLPGGLPVLTNARCPRRYVSGFWRYRNMAGYTSRGTGSSGIPLRFNCKPEITLHELQAGEE